MIFDPIWDRGDFENLFYCNCQLDLSLATFLCNLSTIDFLLPVYMVIGQYRLHTDYSYMLWNRVILSEYCWFWSRRFTWPLLTLTFFLSSMCIPYGNTNTVHSIFSSLHFNISIYLHYNSYRTILVWIDLSSSSICFCSTVCSSLSISLKLSSAIQRSFSISIRFHSFISCSVGNVSVSSWLEQQNFMIVFWLRLNVITKSHLEHFLYE